MSVEKLGLDGVPHHDELAEQSVLGGMMLSKRATLDVLETGISASDFYLPKHAIVYAALEKMSNGGRPCDVVAVAHLLRADGEIERAGGEAYLHELTSLVPTAANAGYYAGIVQQSAIKRRIAEAGISLVQLGNASEGDAFELAETARQRVDEIVLGGHAEVRSVGATVDVVTDAFSDPPRFSPTPFDGLNGLIDGFRPGALYVVGARPGDGKTIVGLQAADHMARHGAVVYISLEMDVADLTKRLYAMKVGIHMTALTRNVLSPHDWERIDAARESIREMPLFVDDRSGTTLTQIRSYVRSVARKQHLAGVVIDYLQLINSTGPQRARWEIVGEYTRALKIMARELDVPVIVLSQLNRQSADGLRPPSLSDLRESGSIEQDADVVILLQRGYDVELETKTDELTMHVAKNRHGQTGKVEFLWEGQFARLAPMPW